MNKKKGNAGLTLLEVVIASAILMIVVGMTMRILFTSSTIVNRSSNTSGLEQRGRQFLGFCRGQFYAGRFRDPQNLQILGLYDSSTQVRYQIPVNRDDTGAMQYGYTSAIGKNDPQLLAPKACVLRFEADTALRESAAAPTASQMVGSLVPPLPALPALKPLLINVDANKNGTQNDTYVSGKIMKYVLIPDVAAPGGQRIESSETLDDQVILGVDASGQFNGKIDPLTGPGSPNPNDSDGVYRGNWLFRYVDAAGNTVLGPFPGTQGIGVLVTTWHGNFDENRKGFLLRRDRETVRFRNPQ